MPVSVRRVGGKYRLIEPGGSIARNRAGTALDGGGHDTLGRARAQQRAVNRAKSASASVLLDSGQSIAVVGKGEYDQTLVLWIRVPESARLAIAAACPFELPEDLHVTVLFWPDVEDDARAFTIAAALDVALRSLPATTARVTGFGDFQASEVAVALLSIPEIERYRSVARAVAEPSEMEYGLVPHATLQRGRHAPVDLPAVEWPVTELEVVRGDLVLRTVALRVDKQRSPTTVQTLIFAKEIFPTRASAIVWARDHDMRYDDVDETSGSWRLRQIDPGRFVDGSFRTIQLREGVQAVIGQLRV